MVRTSSPIGPGSVIAQRYCVKQVLGEGGTGIVFLATDLQLGREVAVKLMSPSSDALPDVAARFEREARVGAALNHPHVVQTLDFGTLDDRSLFLVLQLVRGGDLRAYELRHPIIPIAAALTILSQIAEALEAAHAIELVHRDLKPENILVEEDPALWVRVADFGLAYIVTPPDPRQGRLTHDGMVSGTPAYMSPELVSDQAIGPPSDIYALGCLAYELLVGTTPFEGTFGKVFADHLFAPPVAPRARPHDVPAGLDELVVRMLAKRPTDRPTIEMVRHRLELLSHTDDLRGTRRGPLPAHRAERMLTTPPPFADVAPAPAALRIEVRGTASIELLTALAVAGIEVVGTGEVDARLVLDGTLDEIAAAIVAGGPVFADARAVDFARIADLLRLGVSAVVTKPIVPASMIAKLQRIKPTRST